MVTMTERAAFSNSYFLLFCLSASCIAGIAALLGLNKGEAELQLAGYTVFMWFTATSVDS